MAEEIWHAARLIPTSGISGAQEQERRATSALLAVLSAVKEFGRTILGPLGAPAGTVEAFVEVPFVVGDQKVIPDGLIRVRRGSKEWVALVEVKTGSNQLQAAQLEAYLDVAREQAYDVLLTISNEIPAIAGTHPTNIDRRKIKKVNLAHLSWTHILTRAVVQKEHRGVSDPDQAWILGELIRYLEHPRSGALEMDTMGASWVRVRDSVAAGTLRAADKEAAAVAARWDQLISYAGLRLGRQLGVEVHPTLTRRELAEPGVRTAATLESLATRGVLEGGLRIPDTIAPISISADVRAGLLTAWVDVDAPREGRPRTRVNWLLRQLKDAPEHVRIDCFAAHGKGASTSELLRDLRTSPELLLPDPKREPRSFRVALTQSMGAKGGRGRGSFIDSILDLIDTFYGSTIQTIKPWSATPPKMRPDVEAEDEQPEVRAALVSTSLSSQDGADDSGEREDAAKVVHYVLEEPPDAMFASAPDEPTAAEP